MKKITIATYLRPVTSETIFTKGGSGVIKENIQIFFKLDDGSFYGPKRLNALPTTLKHSYRQDDPFFLKQIPDLERSALYQYIELNRLMAADKMYVVDKERYLESVAVHLKIKQIEPADYLKDNAVLANTAYYKLVEYRIKGPFYMTEKHTSETFVNPILEGSLFVFDVPGRIKPIQTKTTAEAV